MDGQYGLVFRLVSIGSVSRRNNLLETYGTFIFRGSQAPALITREFLRLLAPDQEVISLAPTGRPSGTSTVVWVASQQCWKSL